VQLNPLAMLLKQMSGHRRFASVPQSYNIIYSTEFYVPSRLSEMPGGMALEYIPFRVFSVSSTLISDTIRQLECLRSFTVGATNPKDVFQLDST
jgi:hypothetical protein